MSTVVLAASASLVDVFHSYAIASCYPELNEFEWSVVRSVSAAEFSSARVTLGILPNQQFLAGDLATVCRLESRTVEMRYSHNDGFGADPMELVVDERTILLFDDLWKGSRLVRVTDSAIEDCVGSFSDSDEYELTSCRSVDLNDGIEKKD